MHHSIHIEIQTSCHWSSQLKTQQYTVKPQHARVYCGSGTGRCCSYVAGRRCYMYIQQMAALFCVKWCHVRHLEHVMSYQKSDSVNRGLLCIHLKNIPAEFNPDPMWNNAALGVFWWRSPQQKNKNKNKKTNNKKMNRDIGSVSDQEINTHTHTHIWLLYNW